ncbi:MAG: TadE/TadG family type IV pilus assembly protein [Anaerolineae bacterium]
MLKPTIRKLGCLPVLRRYSEDTRGASMVTAAVTLPLLIIFMMGFYYLFLFMSIKQSLHYGVVDAAQHISDEARYWNIDPTGTSKVGPNPVTGETLYPADYYDMEAKRVIINRLRDIMLPDKVVTSHVFVTVTEPLLAYSPDSTQAPIEIGDIEQLCNPNNTDRGEYRDPENIRFLVYATYHVPLWDVRLPWMTYTRQISLNDRAVGYVECPRWVGQYEQTETGISDKSFWLAREGPFMQYREFTDRTPPAWPTGYPTVTEYPPTEPPTVTVAPTVTPTVTTTPTFTGSETPTQQPTETETPAATQTR